MRICIMAQEEPVCFSPFLRGIILDRPAEVVLVVLAGARGAGNHPRTLRERWEGLLTLWLIWEPAGFIRALGIRVWFFILSRLGLLGSRLDRRSVRGVAQRLKIPIHETDDVRAPALLELLRTKEIDVVINQGEILLGSDLLAVPKKGVVNRHASLLPRFRGRMGSFWAHAAEPPEYGVTIHFVDQGIDPGPIIAQRQVELDPRWSYARVIDRLFAESASLMNAALDQLARPDFTLRPNAHAATSPRRFQGLAAAPEYRRTLPQRRGRGPGAGGGAQTGAAAGGGKFTVWG